MLAKSEVVSWLHQYITSGRKKGKHLTIIVEELTDLTKLDVTVLKNAYYGFMTEDTRGILSSVIEGENQHSQEVIETDKEESLFTKEELAWTIKESRLTVREASSKLGISRQMAHLLLSGRRRITKKMDQKIRRGFEDFFQYLEKKG